MKVFIIAAEAGIKIEAKYDLDTEFAHKAKRYFKQVKEFVADIDKEVMIALQDTNMILGIMSDCIIEPKTIQQCIKRLGNIMVSVNNFINDLPDENKVETPVKQENNLDTEEVMDNAFESIQKNIPNAGIFIMVFNPNDSGVHITGNLDRNFVLTTLLMND